VEQLLALWQDANLEAQRRLLLPMLEAVYVDTKKEKRVMAIKPKTPFRPVFQVATKREGSDDIVLVKNLPLEKDPSPLCFWWRRGGVEPPVQKAPH
jgi:site-specific DNA recombinase